MHRDPDYAAAWARRLMIPVVDLARRAAEPDADYRPRLVAMLGMLGARR